MDGIIEHLAEERVLPDMSGTSATGTIPVTCAPCRHTDGIADDNVVVAAARPCPSCIRSWSLDRDETL